MRPWLSLSVIFSISACTAILNVPAERPDVTVSADGTVAILVNDRLAIANAGCNFVDVYTEREVSDEVKIDYREVLDLGASEMQFFLDEVCEQSAQSNEELANFSVTRKLSELVKHADSVYRIYFRLVATQSISITIQVGDADPQVLSLSAPTGQPTLRIFAESPVLSRVDDVNAAAKVLIRLSSDVTTDFTGYPFTVISNSSPEPIINCETMSSGGVAICTVASTTNSRVVDLNIKVFGFTQRTTTVHFDSSADDYSDQIFDLATSSAGAENPCPDPGPNPSPAGWSCHPSAPVDLTQFAYAWTGSSFLAFSGYQGGDPNRTNLGFEYTPSTGAMRSIKRPGFLSGRAGAAFGWDPEHKVLAVWSGYSTVEGPVMNGGLYSPELDAWRAISTVNAPAASENAGSVMTKLGLLVFAGNYAGSEGGIYSIETESWLPLPIDDRPTGRRGQHVALVGDSKVLVWGGGDGAASTSLPGAILDLDSSTWTSVTNAFEPIRRRNATIVSMGEKVFIWGGVDENENLLNDGAIFTWNTSNLWESIPASPSAPLPRADAPGVWTGSRVLLYGGVSGPIDPSNILSLLADGVASFNPAALTWDLADLSPTNAPQRRGYHSAVWAQGSMLIYGGFGNVVDVASWANGPTVSSIFTYRP